MVPSHWVPSCGALQGGSHGFLACAALYAVGNACIGASPVAYAADVMPAKLGGFGLGMCRCAGDLGKWKWWANALLHASFDSLRNCIGEMQKCF